MKRGMLLLLLFLPILLTGCFTFVEDLINQAQIDQTSSQPRRGIFIDFIGTAVVGQEIFVEEGQTLGVVIQNHHPEDIQTVVTFSDSFGDPTIGGLEEPDQSSDSRIDLTLQGTRISEHDENFDGLAVQEEINSNTLNVYYGGAIVGESISQGTIREFAYTPTARLNTAFFEARVQYDYTLQAGQFICIPVSPEFARDCNNRQRFTLGNNRVSAISFENFRFNMEPAGAGLVTAVIEFDIINNDANGFIVDARTIDFKDQLRFEVDGFSPFVCNRGEALKLTESINHVRCRARGQFETTNSDGGKIETIQRQMNIELPYTYRKDILKGVKIVE